MSPEGIDLEQPQWALLGELVSAVDKTSAEERQPFQVISPGNRYVQVVHHPGLNNRCLEAYPADLKALERGSLLEVTSRDQGYWEFELLPLARGFWRQRIANLQSSLQRVEQAVREYLDGSRLRERYADAYAKIAEADGLLWSTEAEQNATIICHLCREALVLFTTALVNEHKPPDADLELAKTKRRLGSVLRSARHPIGEKTSVFIDALEGYYSALSDLVDRGEHGAAKIGEPVAWDDARRVVFHTLIVMYEVDRALG